MAEVSLQIAASLAMMTVMALLHGVGILAISRGLRLEEERLRALPIDVRAFALIAGIAVSLFLLHLAEIALFAAFYLAVGAVAGIENALFFSASAYATLANSVEGFPAAWRLVGAIEGLVGFILIGWSTALFVTDMHLLLRSKRRAEQR